MELLEIPAVQEMAPKLLTENESNDSLSVIESKPTGSKLLNDKKTPAEEAEASK